MDSTHHISMLRVTDVNGEQAVAACVAAESPEVLGLGAEGGWLASCQRVPSVVLDCTQVVQLVNPNDVGALAAWLSAAAVWLQVQHLEREETK